MKRPWHGPRLAPWDWPTLDELGELTALDREDLLVQVTQTGTRPYEGLVVSGHAPSIEMLEQRRLWQQRRDAASERRRRREERIRREEQLREVTILDERTRADVLQRLAEKLGANPETIKARASQVTLRCWREEAPVYTVALDAPGLGFVRYIQTLAHAKPGIYRPH